MEGQANLKTLNQKAQEKLNAARDAIIAAMEGDPIDFLEVPVIFTGELMGGEIKERTAVAGTPGLANIQYGDDKLFLAKPFAPKDGTGRDIFEKDVQATLGFVPIFVDDWKHYHSAMGEVHCGTNALRERYDFKWWERQPDDIP